MGTTTLKTKALQCGAGKKNANLDFLESALDYAIKYQDADPHACRSVALNFKTLAKDFSKVKLSKHALITRVYFIAFSVLRLKPYSKAKSNNSVCKLLLKVEKKLGRLAASSTPSPTHGTYMVHYFNALKFLCDPISALIKSHYKLAVRGFKGISSNQLSNVEYVFQEFRLIYDSYSKSEKHKFAYEDNGQAVLDVAIGALTLSFTSNQNLKKNARFLKKLISAKWVQSKRFEHLYKPLKKAGQVLHNAKRLKYAQLSYKLCCKAAWKCVTEGELPPDMIHAFVTKTCADSVTLLNILYECGKGSDDISVTLTTLLKSWCAAKKKWPDEIPSPVDLVNQWVMILCKEIKDPEHGDGVKTIYSLMPSSLEKETLGFLLELENKAYEELRDLNPQLSTKMQLTILDILLQYVYTTEDCFSQKLRIIIKKAREYRVGGINHLDECIRLLSEAISTMSDKHDKDKDGNFNMLAKAYCLRALCTQEVQSSKTIFEDINHALKLWSISAEKTHLVDGNTLVLLYCVSDLLSLKGHMDFHSDIYELIIKCFISMNVPLEDCLCMLWRTKSMSHALCVSCVSDAFLLKFSIHHPLSNSVEFWRSCMKKHKSMRLSFKQCFTVTDHSHVTIDDIKKIASRMSKNVSIPPSSTSYISSNLCYELSEMMISSGAMIEALFYAKKALTLRSKHFKFNFECSRGQPNSSNCFQTIVGATKAWSSCTIDSSSQKFILTPWNVLRCYLESTLQVATISEIIGDGHMAETTLLHGKQISDSQDLPIFSVSFSIVLGKIYTKQQRWDLAEREMYRAKVILTSSTLISCSKCKLVLEARVDQQRGDLCKSQFNEAIKAERFYQSAIKKLKRIEWKNCLSNPQKTILRNTTCHDDEEKEAKATKKCGDGSCACVTTCVSDDVNCWHCVPSGVTKSSSLKSITNLKWESTRRRLLIKLFIETGESLWAHGETQKAHREILEGISVLVNRSTFHSTKSTISFNYLKELTQRRNIGGVFAVEHAALLYMICRLSLRNTDISEQPGDMFNLCIPTVVSGLKQSLIGCLEVPELYQKVSRLLAVLYAHPGSFSMLDSSSSSLSMSQWASYFHQASIGANINCMLFYRHLEKQNDHNTMDVDSPAPFSSTLLSLHRLVSESVLDLEEFILKFFQSLPRATIVCISIFDEDYASWLSNVSPCKTAAHHWIMISRLNSDSGPEVNMWPIDHSILAAGEERKTSNTQWKCPWGHTVVDKVAPLFRAIMEELAMRSPVHDDDEFQRQAIKRESYFRNFLRDMEKAWFDTESRKHMLLGERISDGSKVGDGDRKPVILVLDLGVQMLPWESLPVLRDEDVYRMLSVASIAYTLDCNLQEKDSSLFPLIDPSHAYYLVHPSQDLKGDVQTAEWFREHIKKGTAGFSPGTNELIRVLKEHQLFIYLGHGSGNKYIPNKKIEQLEHCPVTLLMGCKSGSLTLSGPYIPHGTPLSYLIGGSPVVVSTLWSVTDDIVDFTKTLVRAWLKAGSRDEASHKASIGSFVGEARAKNMLPSSVGGAIVLYGVPTYICRDEL